MKSGLLLSATGSGCGKTTITCALLEALKSKDIKVKSFKCGPDYIDPMFHKEVLSVDSCNLDLFFCNQEEVRRLFYSDNDSDFSLVEGVMGLYDGRSPDSDEGSSYDLACKLGISVVLIVNAHGMGRSLVALIKGFKAMDKNACIKGIILNQISPMYYDTIKPVIEAECQTEVLGYFPKLKDCNIESRYLGLKLPGEIDSLHEDIKKAASLANECIDIDRMLELCRLPEDAFETLEVYSEENYADKVKIAIARDEAFCFYYEENLKLLEKLGISLVDFSPLNDKALPEGVCGLILGGGYPELHASALSQNESMLRSIREALLKGMPSLAECGGFMYLHDSIENDEGSYPMVSMISGVCQKKERLVRFGYMEIAEKADKFFVGAQKAIKGHEFHYYDSTNNGQDGLSIKPRNNKSWEAGHIDEDHWWGFAHLYYPSNVDFAKAFVEKCRKWRA